MLKFDAAKAAKCADAIDLKKAEIDRAKGKVIDANALLDLLFQELCVLQDEFGKIMKPYIR